MAANSGRVKKGAGRDGEAILRESLATAAEVEVDLEAGVVLVVVAADATSELFLEATVVGGGKGGEAA